MKFKEYRQMADLLYNEWDLGKKQSQAKGKTCAWIYLFQILEETEELLVEKEQEKVIGICGYAKWNSNNHLLRKKFYTVLKNVLIHSPLIKNKNAIYKYNEDYDYTPEELKNYFDGEISILIVDKDYRGKGIGRKLILECFELAQNDNMNNLQILTDESCDFKFYEMVGCKKVYQKVIQYGEPDKCKNICSEEGYIYEKKLVEK